MRLLSLVSLLGAAVLGAAAGDVLPDARAPDLPQGWAMFDGVTLPPFIELTPGNFDEEMAKSKFMLVKLFR